MTADKFKMEISVIIPSFNREKTITRAIESVLNQTFKDFELLIIDDGSTDKTSELVRSFDDRRIHLIELGTNTGVSNARNTGINHAKGKFIALLDSDDAWEPQKLEKQIKIFRESRYGNLGIVGCLRLEVAPSGEIIKQSTHVYSGNVLEDLLSGWMEHYNIMNSSIALIKKDVFNIVGEFDTKLKDHEDYDMWIRIANEFNFDAVDDYLAKVYRWKKEPRMQEEEYFKNKLHFFAKNEKLFKKFPYVYRKKLIWLGAFAIRCNQTKEGRKLFVKVFKTKYFSKQHVPALVHFLTSLLGFRFYMYIYKKLH